MTGSEEQSPFSQHTGPVRSSSKGRFHPNLTKLAAMGLILGCVGVVTTLLLPKPAYEGRLVGQIGDVHIYAIPKAESEEALTVWRGGRKLDPLPVEPSNPIQQFDLSSADRQTAGTRHSDLVIDGWSGGMHCCLTRFVFDGATGNFIGKLALGGSGASRFVPLKRTDPFPAAFLAFDDVTLDGQSIELDSPLAPIVVVWSRKGFSLYREAMKATTPESHAPFMLSEAFQEAQLEIDLGLAPTEGGSKGDIAKALDLAATARLNAMQAANLNPEDARSFAPITGFLNDYVYKGQAEAGFAAVEKAHASTPEVLRVALQTYGTLLRKSQWFDDLNRLNDGRLIRQLDRIDTPAQPKP